MMRQFLVGAVVTTMILAGTLSTVRADPAAEDPRSLVEGPIEAPLLLENAINPPGPGAVILSNTPADYDWWNGCSPTAGGMLFGWWDEAGVESFPGNHRNLPATYSNTSTNQTNYTDARGVVAGWAHKQEGMAQSLTYGHYANHAPDSIADFLLTSNGGSSRGNMAHGFEMFGAWDDPRTPEIESATFQCSTVYTFSGWSYADYCAEIDAGRPVHLGLNGATGGHSVLGIGYNNTDGKTNVVVHTTWHSGQQEWEWENETHSGYSFSVYGATLTQKDPTPTPDLSAYVSIAHTYIGNLIVEIGYGDPANPDWSTIVWNHDGSGSDNLVLTDLDCTAALEDFLAGELDWYVKVADNAGGNTGTLEDFQIRYGPQGRIYEYDGPAMQIGDLQTITATVTTPEPTTMALLGFGFAALAAVRRRRR